MIKINLLAEKKKDRGDKGIKLPSGSGGGGTPRNILLVAIILVGLVIAAFWNYRLNTQIDDWQTKTTAAEAELLRLEAIRKKGEMFEAQKALLARKIDLITDLKKQQAVPVHILDQISWNLPDFLWLKSMNVGANGINLVGRATTYNAVTNFYNNLSDSEYFTAVTLGRTAEGDQGVSFSLTCQFVPPGSADGENEEAASESDNES
jgi:type IV pilus assembly protein PilN